MEKIVTLSGDEYDSLVLENEALKNQIEAMESGQTFKIIPNSRGSHYWFRMFVPMEQSEAFKELEDNYRETEKQLEECRKKSIDNYLIIGFKIKFKDYKYGY